LLLAAAASAFLAGSASAQFDRHGEIYYRHNKGRKMTIARATFFGTAGAEEFVGVAVTPDGKIVAVGNSWGPPFPQYVPCEVLGPDQPWDVPLFRNTDPAGVPSPENPNRTGFLVFYSQDLKKAERAVRFGWGSADISATCAMRDGSFILAGRATPLFRAATANVPVRKFLPAGTNEYYGTADYAGKILPGDVYVARLESDLRTIRWVWFLEGHRAPPPRVAEGIEGQTVFRCHGLKRITADGAKLMTFEGTELEKMEHYFKTVHPEDGSVLVGGSWLTSTGREPWKMPFLYVYNGDGRPKRGYYAWPGLLVGHDDFRQVSDSGIEMCTAMSGDEIGIVGRSDGGNTVFCNHPADLQKYLPEIGLGMSLWGAGAGAFYHIVRFSMKDDSDAYHTLWASYLQTSPNACGISGMRGARDGSLLLFGGSAGWLIQTSTNWFRAPDQYLRKTQGVKMSPDGTCLYEQNGWPKWQGIGGRGGYAAILSRKLDSILWSSATALCDPTDAAECRGGFVVVSKCLGYNARDGRTFCLLDNDIADWPGLAKALVSQGRAAADSGAKRFWDRMDAATRTALQSCAGQDVPEHVRQQVRDALDRVVSDSRDLYSPDIWPESALGAHEKKLLAQTRKGTIHPDDRGDFNRRLLERTFPEHVFVCPKDNLAPVLDAVQDEFGGGYSDGHIYLLTWPRKAE
jgi:hypothetical protein